MLAFSKGGVFHILLFGPVRSCLTNVFMVASWELF